MYLRPWVGACMKRTRLPATGKCHEEHYYIAILPSAHAHGRILNAFPTKVIPLSGLLWREAFDLRDERRDATNFVRTVGATTVTVIE